MTLLRFVVPHVDKDSAVPKGLLSAAYELSRSDDVSSEQRDSIQSILVWFEKHVSIPDRFSRTSSKGFYRRSAKGIAWFRDTATDCISRMHQLKAIAESHGWVVHVLTEDRVGYVVYEDDMQVIAEPFADTKTSP